MVATLHRQLKTVINYCSQTATFSLQNMATILSSRQPSLCEDDIQCIVQEQKVFVETSEFSEGENTVSGTVRVQNITHNKNVYTRYTLNNWKTYADLKATWEESIGDKEPPETDQFHFAIPLPSRQWVGIVHFAIRYEVAGQIYWDSNEGKNYKVKVCRKNIV